MGRGAKQEVAIYLRAYDKTKAGLQAAGARVGRFTNNAIKHFKRAALAAGIMVSAASAASIGIGASFEQGMANVASVTSATESQYAALEDRARSLGATTAFTAREATTAMYALGSAGFKTEQIIASTEGVLKLAGATLSDMSSAAELNVAALKQFGLEAHDTDRVVNAMAAGIQNSMLTMERLTYSMQFAGPAAASVGMSIEETVAALGLLHNAGLRGSLAGTGLRMAMVRLLKPTEDLKKVLGGVSITGDGFAATLDKISKARLTPEQMVEMFGPRAYGAMRAFLVAGKEGFDQMTDAVTGTTAAYSMYETQMDTVQSQWRIFRSALEETALVVFDQMRPALRAVLDWAIQFVNENRERLIPVLQRVIEVGIYAGAELRAGFEHAKLAWLKFVHSIENETTLVGKAIGWLTGKVVGIFDAGEEMTLEQIKTAMSALQAESGMLRREHALLQAEIQFINAGMCRHLLLGAWSRRKELEDSGGRDAYSAKREATARENLNRIIDRSKEIKAEWDQLLSRLEWADEENALIENVDRVYDQRDKMIAEFRRLWGKGELSRAIKEAVGSKFYEGEEVGPFPATMEWKNTPVFDMPEFQGPQLEEAFPLAEAVEKQGDKARTAADKAMAGLGMSVRRGWDSIIDTSMTGAEKWADIWGNMKRVAWRYLGDILVEQLKNDATSTASTVTSETTKTSAAVGGAAARAAAANVEIAANNASTLSRIKNAVAGFFSFFSPLGPFGIPAALASIALMVKTISEIGKMAFYDGGWVSGPKGRDRVGPAWLNDGEFIMPTSRSRQYASELEAMREGRYKRGRVAVPVASASAGGPTKVTQVNVSLEPKPGTVITASDRLGIRRLTELVADDLVRVLKQQGIEVAPDEQHGPLLPADRRSLLRRRVRDHRIRASTLRRPRLSALRTAAPARPERWTERQAAPRRPRSGEAPEWRGDRRQDRGCPGPLARPVPRTVGSRRQRAQRVSQGPPVQAAAGRRGWWDQLHRVLDGPRIPPRADPRRGDSL